MRYRVVFNLLLLARAFVLFVVLIRLYVDGTSWWLLAPAFLALLFLSTEWIAEKISRQPRVRPFERREGYAAEG